MRVEDWQDWIEKQFLDTNPPPQDADRAEPATMEQAPPASEELPTSGLTETPARPSASALQQALATAPPSPVPSGSRRPPADTGIEDLPIPTIERYFPFLKTSREPAPSAPEPPRPVDATAAPPEPTEPPIADAEQEPAVAVSLPSEPDVALDEPEPLSLSEPRAEDAAPEHAAEPERAGLPRSRRRHPRSRPARATPPPELAPPLTSEEFWKLAPRHVRTLIAMGQDDTVQRSYKRQFKESRLALIERILDPTLSLEETARLLNVCPTTVRRYTNKGLLRHQRTPGDQRRFKLSDVLSFMEAHLPSEER